MKLLLIILVLLFIVGSSLWLFDCLLFNGLPPILRVVVRRVVVSYSKIAALLAKVKRTSPTWGDLRWILDGVSHIVHTPNSSRRRVVCYDFNILNLNLLLPPSLLRVQSFILSISIIYLRSIIGRGIPALIKHVLVVLLKFIPLPLRPEPVQSGNAEDGDEGTSNDCQDGRHN